MSRSPLPAPDLSLAAEYRRLVAEIDTAVRQLSLARFADTLHCRPGCSSCCIPFRVLPLEAAMLREALRNRAEIVPNTGSSCRLLVDDRCIVYPHRPIICRTQGLPIGYVDETSGSIEVSACPLNFADTYQFSHEELFFLDRFNNRLAELNLRYGRMAGLNPRGRIPIALIAATV